MFIKTFALIFICSFLVTPGCAPAPTGTPGAPGRPAVEKKLESIPGGLHSYGSTGFKAVSETLVKVDRGDGLVEMTDVSSLNLVAAGDFSFLRTRTHKGAADGVSEESVAAIKVGGSYYTAGSSGLWVRWDDELDQPGQVITRFIDSGEAILRIVAECGRTQPSEIADRVDVSISSDSCRFETGSVNRYSGTLRELSGFIVSNAGNPVEVSLKMAFDSAVDGVAAAVALEYSMKAVSGGVAAEIVPPVSYSESRRPRPIKMVESVLSGIVNDWGPGAPDSVRKK
jgi:hypothetical protein